MNLLRAMICGAAVVGYCAKNAKLAKKVERYNIKMRMNKEKLADVENQIRQLTAYIEKEEKEEET